MKLFLPRALLIACFGFLFALPLLAQDKFDSIQSQLKALAEQYPGLEERVEMNVSDVNLSDFLNTIAIGNRLNISVDETLNFSVTNNFSDVTVIDVLIFLAKKYDLDIKLIGSIIILSKHKVAAPPPIIVQPKSLNISYDSAGDQLSMDLKKDTLYSVAREITIITGKNIVIPQELNNTVVSGFIQNQSFPVALSMLAYANNLKVTTSPDGLFIFERKEPEKLPGGPNTKSFNSLNSKKGNRVVNGLELKVEDGLITLSATAVSIQDIIVAVTEKLDLNYFLFSDIKGSVTLNLENATYEGLLSFLLNGTEYTYRKDNDIYLFGERNMEGLRSAKVLQLKFRTVDKLIDFIPAELKKGIEIKPFPDLNSLILSGSQPRITELQNFITEVDRVVPMISIEVIIMEVSNTSEVTKGITAGLSQTPVQTQGSIFPGINLTLSSSSINNVIDKIGGLASLDLGHVSPSFYVTLQLLETNGHVKIRSTPKLSTLNGHPATISIGETEYYLETQNTVVGTQNPQNITTQQYKSVNADLSVTINPMVAGDEQITMDIKVKQSTFTARISPTAPPGNTTRNFESLLRVKNDDMILLGGLDEDNTSDTGSGIPGLARIPVLNWIFGNRDRTKSKDRLVVLVKPTILY